MLCTGVVTGPLMGAFMLGRGYSATAVYYMQVISGAAHSLLLLLFLQETLPTDQREPFRGFRCAQRTVWPQLAAIATTPDCVAGTRLPSRRWSVAGASCRCSAPPAAWPALRTEGT